MKIVGQLKAMLGLDKSQFDKGLNDVEKKSMSFGASLKKIGGLLGVAFGVKEVMTFSKEAMKLAAESEGIKTAFKNMGVDVKAVFSDLKRATRGVIPEDELMQMALKAQSLGISFRDLGVYLTFATNQSIRLGKPIQEMADLIINAVGRNSSRGLYQLGISTKEAEDAFKSADGFVTLISRHISDMGTVADTSAIKIGKLATAGVELKEAWGNWLNKSKTVGAFREYFTTILNAWSDESKDWTEKFMMLMPFYGGNFIKPKGYTDLNPLAPGTESEGGPLTKSVPKKQAETIADLRTKIEDYKKAIDETLVSDQARRNEILKQIDALQKLIDKYTTLSKEINRIAAVQTAGTENINIPLFGNYPSKTSLAGPPASASDYEKEKASITAVTEELKNQQEAVQILANGFDALFTSTENGFKAMIDSIIKGIEKLIAELLAKVVILTILNIISGGSVSFGTILKVAAGIGGGSIGGGISSGPSASVNPGIMDSGSMIGAAKERSLSGSIAITVQGNIQNRSIALTGRRAEMEN